MGKTLYDRTNHVFQIITRNQIDDGGNIDYAALMQPNTTYPPASFSSDVIQFKVKFQRKKSRPCDILHFPRGTAIELFRKPDPRPDARPVLIIHVRQADFSYRSRTANVIAHVVLSRI